MEHKDIESQLQDIGLSKDQAAVYLYLLRNGALSATMLSKRLGITRTLIYKIVDDLSKLGLVTKDESFKVTRFRAEHPFALRKIAEQQRIQAEKTADAIEHTLTPLLSEFNLHSNKPAVHFLEGLEGVREVLEDTLTATECIYMYSDPESLVREVSDINEDYVKRRIKKGVSKKILRKDSELARQHSNTAHELSEIRIVKGAETPEFHSVLNIYDKKVSAITYKDNVFTSFIIHDESLYTMQRFAFEALWNASK